MRLAIFLTLLWEGILCDNAQQQLGFGWNVQTSRNIPRNDSPIRWNQDVLQPQNKPSIHHFGIQQQQQSSSHQTDIYLQQIIGNPAMSGGMNRRVQEHNFHSYNLRGHMPPLEAAVLSASGQIGSLPKPKVSRTFGLIGSTPIGPFTWPSHPYLPHSSAHPIGSMLAKRPFMPAGPMEVTQYHPLAYPPFPPMRPIIALETMKPDAPILPLGPFAPKQPIRPTEFLRPAIPPAWPQMQLTPSAPAQPTETSFGRVSLCDRVKMAENATVSTMGVFFRPQPTEGQVVTSPEPQLVPDFSTGFPDRPLPWSTPAPPRPHAPQFPQEPVLRPHSPHCKQPAAGKEGTAGRLSPSAQACQRYQNYTTSSMNRELRAGGGERTEMGEFPYMVAIGYVVKGKLYWHCGGSLISERFVLTAAHCLPTEKCAPNPRESLVLRAGAKRLLGSERRANDYGAEAVVLHPRSTDNGVYYDLALVRTDRPVSFSHAVRPVCLPPAGAALSQGRTQGGEERLEAAGWGAQDSDPRTAFTGELQKVPLMELSAAQCEPKIQGKTRVPQGLNGLLLCTQHSVSNICKGDSGGPLVARRVGIPDTLLGVASVSGNPCIGGTIALFARTEPELQWIERVVWP